MDDRFEITLAEPLELKRVVPSADLIGHLQDDRAAEPAASVADLTHAKPAVPVGGPDDADAGVAELAVNVVDQQVAHLPVVADAAEDPGNVGLDERRVGIAAVHHGDFGLQRHADGDVAVGAVDRAEDRPKRGPCTPS